MTTEVLTGYSETDPGTFIDVTADRVTLNALRRNISAVLEYNFGAGYFSGNIQAAGQLNVSVGAAGGLFAFGFGSASGHTTSAAPSNGAIIQIYANGTTTFDGYALNYHSGAYTAGNPIGSTGSIGAGVYYYTMAVLSSLSRYGGIYFGLFSDSGKTTLVQCTAKSRTGADTYQYFKAAASYNDANAAAITANNELITLSVPDDTTGTIDLSTLTEVDPGSVIAPYTNVIEVNAMPCNAAAYDYVDKGAGHYSGDYEFLFVLNNASLSGSSAKAQMCELANTLGESNSIANCEAVQINYISAGNYRLAIRERYNSSEYFSTTTGAIPFYKPVWGKFKRTGTTVTLNLYNDPARLSQLGSQLTLTAHALQAWRYLYSVCSFSISVSQTVTLNFGGLKDITAVPGDVADSIVLTDSTVGIRSRIGAIADSMALSEAITGLRNIIGVIADSVALIDESTGGIAGSTYVTDSVALSDAGTALRIRIATSAESMALGDAMTGSVIGNVYNFRPWFIEKWNYATETWEPVIGLTANYQLYDKVNQLTCDFGDAMAFKTAGSCIDAYLTMIERDATYWPGWYDAPLQTLTLDGTYEESAKVLTSPKFYTESNEVIFVGGIEQNGTAAQVRTELTAELAALMAIYNHDATYTAAEIARINDAILHGRVTGAGVLVGSNYVETFSNRAGTKAVVRITSDANGNRSLVEVLDAS